MPMKSKDYINADAPAELSDETVPETRYFKEKADFDAAVGEDFIEYANKITDQKQNFLVGLSHGQSAAGAYEYIIEHFDELWHPGRIQFTFVNSKLNRQKGLTGVTDAIGFLKALMAKNLIDNKQIMGSSSGLDNKEAYAEHLNKEINAYLKKNDKTGMDYAFLASDPSGRVAGITRNSTAFDSQEVGVVVEYRNDKRLTLTPHFISLTKRIAFLATKADKRRPLAWLFYRWARANESPGFLRHIEHVKEKMTVFIDDKALTWPQVEIIRPTQYGATTIRVDLAKIYNEDQKTKLPVVLMIHGFMGLNTFDGLLAAIPSRKYIAAAMHYGTIPHSLPPIQYSQFVAYNIDAVISYFGRRGHPVYIFDHSMANIYFMMMDRAFDKLDGVKKYLRGRIGANPFFGIEAKHALLGFMDNVILRSRINIAERAIFSAARTIIPWDTKRSVRRRSISLTEWLIKTDTALRESIWRSVKERILYLMSNLDSLPHLNRIPIEQALNRLPAKVFAIQIHSALEVSKTFDNEKSLMNMAEHTIPVLILKSERDSVAKYYPGIYEGSELTEVFDITNEAEKDLFREHLFHMVNPQQTTRIIDKFITETEQMRENVNTKTKAVA